MSDILLRRETIERKQFIELIDGRSGADVFGPDEPVVPAPPAPPGAPERRPERLPGPLPRPSFAAQMRGRDGR